MRVTSIGLYTANDVQVALLSFRDPRSTNPYVAKNIIGLDADEIVPRFYAQSLNKDGKYFDLSIPSREIVLSIMLNPDYGEEDKTYSDLRDDIYKAVSASRTGALNLRFYNDLVETARITGFVIKLEYPHFTDFPEVQLTLRCDDPMLRGPVQVPLRGRNNATNSIFEVKDSTAPHGFQFKLTFTANAPSFYIQDPELDWQFLVEPTTQFLTNDVLIFSSEAGDKELKMVRASVETQLVDKIKTTSVWPILFPGVNKLMHTTGVKWEYIRYYPTYWGV